MTEPVVADEAEILGDLAELEQFVEGVELSQTDDLSRSFLAAATLAVRNYCGWHVFPVKERTIVEDGSGATELILPTLRVVEITAITENGVALIPEIDFEWSQMGMVRRSYGAWTNRYRSISVSLRDGYSHADDLVLTIYALAARAASSPSGAVADNAGPFTFSAAQLSAGSGGGLGLFAHEQAILDVYRLPSI
ncbi:hypothetical protein CH296_00410 [Rhodococcus sp. 14-2496-1d]|uniref:hypothetical protein n=1 Tax=Rhodococcus sp. 14-2496-1d TaxID=2023146 RepID=UPI000B9A8138|nr:hypothetical protein [Rhodococcus sp. 14-2496-1d]OZF40754.1 hypothetical protein CH296_00410 [Rhodococcus sp. 14-2496-1d]